LPSCFPTPGRKGNRVANAQERRWESAGWLFWAVGVAVLVGPAIWLTSRIVWEGTEIQLIVLTGVVFALIGSGIITVAVNAALQSVARKRRAAERKGKKSKK
jgi:hypothetical protein